MALTKNRYTILALTLILVMALGLVLGLFVEVKPVQARARACGWWYLHSGLCHRRIATVYSPLERRCPPWPAYYLVETDRYERYMNPHSYRKVEEYRWKTCHRFSEGCPRYCN